MELARTTAVRATLRDQSRVKSYYEHWRDGTTPPETPQGAVVDLALIATTPQQLAEMAGRKADLDGHSRPSATESNDLSVGPSAIASQQPTPAIHGEPSPEKEAPKPPLDSQSAQVASGGAPSPPAAQELERRREAFERTRAEHRRANWEKYRYAK